MKVTPMVDRSSEQRSSALQGIGRPMLVACLCFALPACATRGGSVPYEREGFVAPDTEVRQLPVGPHRLAPMDKVRVTVFQVEELSGEYEVDRSGQVTLPLVGSFEAQGSTAQELAQQIRQRLTERYMHNPNVQVAITATTDTTITIDGAVTNPGAYPIVGQTTLMQAVALGRGLTQDANPARVVVFRTIDGQRMAAAFDLQAIRRAEAEDPAIYGNDIIVVDGSRARAMFRDILSTIPILGLFRPF
jgi:polysaccharide biosynthesis/export protein